MCDAGGGTVVSSFLNQLGNILTLQDLISYKIEQTEPLRLAMVCEATGIE